MRKFTDRERARRILWSFVAGLALTTVVSTSRICFASQIDLKAEDHPAGAAPGNPPAAATSTVSVLQDRVIAEGVELAKIDPDQSPVGINLRRGQLAEVFREILGSHNLRFAVDDGEVLITNRPPEPGGVKRKKTADDALIERVSPGNAVVSDKNEEAKAKEPQQATSRAVVQLDQPEANDPAQKEMKERERRYFRKQFRMALRTELALSLRACRPTPEQRTEIRKAAEKAFEEAGEKWVDVQVQMKRGGNDPPPKYPNIKEEVQQAITATVNRLLPADAAAAHKREVDARIEHRKKTTIRNLVSMVDRNVNLSAEQRQQLTAQMAKHWSPDWGNGLEYMQWMDNVFPTMPVECLDSVLNDNQKKVWAGVRNIQRSEYWGVGFGYFNTQFLLDSEDVCEDVGVAVEEVITLPAAVEAPPSDEEPGAENAAEEEPVPEKPVPEKPLPEKPSPEKPGDG